MKFTVVGIVENKNLWLNQEIIETINNHKIFSGGKRHLDIVKQYLPKDYKWINISVPLEKTFEEYNKLNSEIWFLHQEILYFMDFLIH